MSPIAAVRIPAREDTGTRTFMRVPEVQLPWCGVAQPPAGGVAYSFCTPASTGTPGPMVLETEAERT